MIHNLQHTRAPFVFPTSVSQEDHMYSPSEDNKRQKSLLHKITAAFELEFSRFSPRFPLANGALDTRHPLKRPAYIHHIYFDVFIWWRLS